MAWLPERGIARRMRLGSDPEARMADKELVAWLTQDLSSWNQWRSENPRISPPDLRAANLEWQTCTRRT